MFKTIKRGLRGWHNSLSHPEEVWGLVNKIEIAATDEIEIPAGLKLTQEQARLVARAAARAAADASASRPRKKPPTILVNPKNIGDGTLAALREFTQHLSPENILEDHHTRVLYFGDFRYGAQLPPIPRDECIDEEEPSHWLRAVIREMPGLPKYMQPVALNGNYPKRRPPSSYVPYGRLSLPDEDKQLLLNEGRKEYTKGSCSTEAYKRDEAESKWKIRQKQAGVSIDFEKEFHDRLEEYISVPVFPPLIWPESEIIERGLDIDAYRACETIDELKEYWKKTRYEERMKAHKKWAGVIREEAAAENGTAEQKTRVAMAYFEGTPPRSKNTHTAYGWISQAKKQAPSSEDIRSKYTKISKIENPNPPRQINYSNVYSGNVSTGYYPSRGGGSSSGSATHHPNGVPYAVMEGEMGRQNYNRIGNKRH